MHEKLDPFMGLVKGSTEEIDNEIKCLANVIRLNTRTLTEKLNKFSKVFQDCLKTIEKNISKNQETYISIEKDIQKLGKEFNTGGKDEVNDNGEENQENKQEAEDSIVEEIDTMMTQPKTNKKKKKWKIISCFGYWAIILTCLYWV